MLNSKENGARPPTSVIDLSPRPENLVPYSYELVPDTDLREFMDRFDQGTEDRKIGWPVKMGHFNTGQAALLLGVSTTDLVWIIPDVKKRGIIKPSLVWSGNRNQTQSHYLDQNTARAFASLFWAMGQKYPRNEKGRLDLSGVMRETFPWGGIVAIAKDALGSNPLADLIHEPSGKSNVPAESRNGANSEPSEGSEDVEGDIYYSGRRGVFKDPFSTVVKEIDREQKERALNPLPRILKIDSSQCEIASDLGREELKRLYDRIPGNRHEFIFPSDKEEKKKLEDVIRLVVGIDALNHASLEHLGEERFEKLIRFNRDDLAGLNNGTARFALDVCIRYLTKYPKLNLKELFDVLQSATEKNPERYGSKV